MASGNLGDRIAGHAIRTVFKLASVSPIIYSIPGIIQDLSQRKYAEASSGVVTTSLLSGAIFVAADFLYRTGANWDVEPSPYDVEMVKFPALLRPMRKWEPDGYD